MLIISYIGNRIFLMGVPACEINSNTISKETMIIQGIIDLCFVENDKYVIVDYKTGTKLTQWRNLLKDIMFS